MKTLLENLTRPWLKYKRTFLLSLVGGLIIAAIGFGIVAASGITNGEEGEIEDIAPGAISITDMEARGIVQEAYPDATVKEVDLDTNDGMLVYDVGLDNGDEIVVNARTGDIVGTESDDSDNGDDNDDD